MNLIDEKALEAYIKNTTLKQLLIVPAILLILSLSILAYTTYRTGSPLELGLEFKGGTAVYLDTAKTPDQLKLPFALWTRKAVQEAIAQHYGVILPMRTVGEYLHRWGFTPQKPVKRAYEQQPERVSPPTCGCHRGRGNLTYNGGS